MSDNRIKVAGYHFKFFSYIYNKDKYMEFIEKAKLKHNNKYDYSNIEYKNNYTKIKIVCPEHGVFEQTPNSHISGCGCPICGNVKKLTTETFKIKAKEIHNDRYDYSLVNYINTKTKVKIICLEHGEFEQTPNSHLKGQGCSMCGNNFKSNTTYFVEKVKLIHGDRYDYSLVNYVNNYTKIEIICPEHGLFEPRPKNHLNGSGCPICRESKGEKEIRKYLIKNNINFKPQHKFNGCKDKLLLPFDFYLPDHNVCIEYDGIQHYESVKHFGGNDNLIITQYRDKLKDLYCKNNNIKLIRVSYKEDVISKINILNE